MRTPCALVGRAAVGVHYAAVVAHGFGPVIACVESVDAGISVEDTAGAFAVHHRPVRIEDIPGQRGLAVAGVLRRSPDREGRVLLARMAVEGFVGHNGVDVQLIGAASGVHPMLGGVAVGGRLGGKGRAGEHGHDRENGQEKRENPATTGMGMICFQEKYLRKIDFCGRWKKLRSRPATERIMY